MSYKLFLDDLRSVNDVISYKKNYIYKKDGWEIAKNYDQFVSIIIKLGIPDFVSFDHDLGDICDTHTEKTGYDCVKWLVNYCLNNNLIFPKYDVHSMNTVGKQNIIEYIKNYKKTL